MMRKRDWRRRDGSHRLPPLEVLAAELLAARDGAAAPGCSLEALAWYAAVTLRVLYGLRRTELALLRVGDVGGDDSALWLRVQLKPAGDEAPRILTGVGLVEREDRKGQDAPLC